MKAAQQQHVAGPTEEELVREFTDSSLEYVSVTPLAVLKIVKHCQDSLPASVTGQLVGLANGGVLEVTNCMPTLDVEDEEVKENPDAAVQYSLDILRALRDVSMDSDTVGWYTTAYAESFVDKETVGLQYDWQKNPKAVMLVFDPLRTTQDSAVALRAYRLSQRFLALFASLAPQQHPLTVEMLRDAKVSFADVFEEVPVRVATGAYEGVLLADLAADPMMRPQRERIDTAVYPYLEKNAEYLIGSLDDFASQQGKFQAYHKSVVRAAHRRRKFEQLQQEAAAAGNPLSEEQIQQQMQQSKPLQQPPQLDTLLVQTQMSMFCDQLSHVAEQGAAKLFLLGSLQTP